MIIPTFLRLTSGAGKNFSEITIFGNFQRKLPFLRKSSDYSEFGEIRVFT